MGGVFGGIHSCTYWYGICTHRHRSRLSFCTLLPCVALIQYSIHHIACYQAWFDAYWAMAIIETLFNWTIRITDEWTGASSSSLSYSTSCYIYNNNRIISGFVGQNANIGNTCIYGFLTLLGVVLGVFVGVLMRLVWCCGEILLFTHNLFHFIALWRFSLLCVVCVEILQ